jgi:hypothetical protein
MLSEEQNPFSEAQPKAKDPQHSGVSLDTSEVPVMKVVHFEGIPPPLISLTEVSDIENVSATSAGSLYGSGRSIKVEDKSSIGFIE